MLGIIYWAPSFSFYYIILFAHISLYSTFTDLSEVEKPATGGG
jgi:hypothetical protein